MTAAAGGKRGPRPGRETATEQDTLLKLPLNDVVGATPAGTRRKVDKREAMSV